MTKRLENLHSTYKDAKSIPEIKLRYEERERDRVQADHKVKHEATLKRRALKREKAATDKLGAKKKRKMKKK